MHTGNDHSSQGECVSWQNDASENEPTHCMFDWTTNKKGISSLDVCRLTSVCYRRPGFKSGGLTNYSLAAAGGFAAAVAAASLANRRFSLRFAL